MEKPTDDTSVTEEDTSNMPGLKKAKTASLGANPMNTASDRAPNAQPMDEHQSDSNAVATGPFQDTRDQQQAAQGSKQLPFDVTGESDDEQQDPNRQNAEPESDQQQVTRKTIDLVSDDDGQSNRPPPHEPGLIRRSIGQSLKLSPGKMSDNPEASQKKEKKRARRGCRRCKTGHPNSACDRALPKCGNCVRKNVNCKCQRCRQLHLECDDRRTCFKCQGAKVPCVHD